MIEDRITVKNALINGDLLTKLSAVVMGAGIAGHKQIIKGAVVLLLEIAFWVFMISQGFHNLSMLPSHGRGIWPGDVLKKVSRGLFRVEAGNPGFPRLVQVTSGGFSRWL